MVRAVLRVLKDEPPHGTDFAFLNALKHLGNFISLFLEVFLNRFKNQPAGT